MKRIEGLLAAAFIWAIGWLFSELLRTSFPNVSWPSTPPMSFVFGPTIAAFIVLFVWALIKSARREPYE